MSPESGMAELFGKDTGCARGLGGSMHFFDAETNFMGGWGIVGGHLALAAGAAFKSKYTGDGRVTICFFGEGATNIGGFHEAMSLSGLWKLPIVFVCENNQYAMGTPMSRTSPIEDLTLKAQGYGMAGDHCEGHDVRVTSERIRVAVERGAQRRRAHLHGDRDLPLPRAFHERPGQVPARRPNSRSASSVTP
jgi:pyruvate dehydrogenase E1 component alpha subunit